MKNLKFLLFILLLAGCATPKINIIDRPSIMEMESSGEWPLLEDSLKKQTQTPGPTPFPKIETTGRKKKLQSLLNEELAE
jgi:hypothetical protein